MAAFARGDSSINVASNVHAARVVGFSSEALGCAAANVLDSNTSKVNTVEQRLNERFRIFFLYFGHTIS